MFRSMLCSLIMLGACVGCAAADDKQTEKDKSGKDAKEAKITKVDAKKGTATVQMQIDGKEVEKTFRLAEDIEYMDSTGRVAATDIFTSGDLVLIVERDGKITKMKKKDHQTFLQAADEINIAEMKIGKVAEEHGASAAVKAFGERMVRDHSLMNKELRAITSKKGISIAEGLDHQHQVLVSQLSKLKGSEFDHAYTQDMVTGHEKAIKEFENEAKNGQDADVKAWANKWLPTLREHLKLAQDTAKGVKGT